jgi:regulator of protease activity HflC (stomatin/prohibitin superfamily)
MESSAGQTAPRRRMRGMTSVWTVGAALLIGVVIALIVVIGWLSGYDKTNGGEVAVVRNGGLFDNNRIRQVIDPGSGLTWTGMWSHTHKYPAQQRFYTITASNGGGDRPGVDVVHTPTSDGVDVGIEGTLYFTLNQDHATLENFDDKYGTRKFRGLDGEARYAWQGDDGWSGFLDQVVRPVIDNDLREQINNFRCSELVSSCVLVQNSGGSQQKVDTNGGQTNNGNIAKVQSAINSSLSSDLSQTLGGTFITGIRFNLVRITLPDKVQEAVNDAQAAFAQVTQAQARVQQAKADALANRQRQRGYKDCPACAQIDTLKAIPPNVTTFAPGGNFAITK